MHVAGLRGGMAPWATIINVAPCKYTELSIVARPCIEWPRVQDDDDGTVRSSISRSDDGVVVVTFRR